MPYLKITLICPAHNEEFNLGPLINSIKNQTRKPDEVIFVEDSSTDETYNVLKNFQLNNKNVKVFRVKNKNISKNRNFAIKKSKGEIIVCVDAGCKLENNYLEKIISPFNKREISFVGGISKIFPKNLFDKCFSLFVEKNKLSKTYLPKGHAMAFRKDLWKKVGGFPENLALGAEDTFFGKKAISIGFKPFIVHDAFVYWETRSNLMVIFKQFKSYGYWDAKAFNFFKLPLKSKLNLLISILFPLSILHSIYMGFKCFNHCKKIKSIYYGITIDLSKIYGYSFGWIKGIIL